jgi:C-terminal processing protease CtpA/Prc
VHISTFTHSLFTVDLIAGLLANQLNNTDGLLLDVRDNGGGALETAAALVQLFKENPVSMTGKIKITEETKSAFEQ